MASYGHDKCQTISCPNRATGTLTYTPKGFEECTERVCGVCAEDYVNRPVLRATFTLDGAHETQPEETDAGWAAACSCGWVSDEIRADTYADAADDPADKAHDVAYRAGKRHERNPH